MERNMENEANVEHIVEHAQSKAHEVLCILESVLRGAPLVEVCFWGMRQVEHPLAGMRKAPLWGHAHSASGACAHAPVGPQECPLQGGYPLWVRVNTCAMPLGRTRMPLVSAHIVPMGRM